MRTSLLLLAAGHLAPLVPFRYEAAAADAAFRDRPSDKTVEPYIVVYRGLLEATPMPRRWPIVTLWMPRCSPSR